MIVGLPDQREGGVILPGGVSALGFLTKPFLERLSQVWPSPEPETLAALPPPAIDLTAVDLPTVTTGGGLRVPRVPVWQSVRGSLVTVPPGVDLSPRSDEPRRLTDLRARLAGVTTTKGATP